MVILVSLWGQTCAHRPQFYFLRMTCVNRRTRIRVVKERLDINEIVAMALVFCGLAIWWIKNNLALAFLVLRILFYIAVIIIAIYCVTRLF